MLITPTDFRATLTAKLEQGALLLPISDADRLDLISQLGEDGNYTYLTIRAENIRSEIVKVTVQCGELVLTRGQDGTKDLAFPRGSCVLFTLTPAIVKDLICNYDCCEDEECPCVEVTAAGATLPAGTVGASWSGVFVFTGDVPMAIVADVPTWMTVVQSANYLTLSGTPPIAGTYNVAASATNCSGAIAIQQGVVTIT